MNKKQINFLPASHSLFNVRIIFRSSSLCTVRYSMSICYHNDNLSFLIGRKILLRPMGIIDRVFVGAEREKLGEKWLATCPVRGRLNQRKKVRGNKTPRFMAS